MLRKLSFLMAILLALNANFAFAELRVKDIKEVNREEIDKIKCDSTFERTLNKGDTCNFYVNFSVKDGKVKISSVDFWFWSDEDYNGDDSMVSFKPTQEAMDAKWVVGSKPVQLLRSSDYKIRFVPKKSSEENILVKYEILFNPFMPNGELSPEQERYVVCGRYGVKK